MLGVDVGFSPVRRSSAVCRLDWTESRVSWTLRRFRASDFERRKAVTEVAGTANLITAAFDGPLRSGLDVIGRYRMAERMLSKGLPKLVGKPGQSSAPVGKLLNEHANLCVHEVLGLANLAASKHDSAIHERSVVEAFPSSFLGLLIADPKAMNVRRGDRSDKYFVHAAAAGLLDKLLWNFLPGRQLEVPFGTVRNHDDRAALVCAVTALCVAGLDYTAVGDGDGWIILPPQRFIQPLQLQLLLANAELYGKGTFRSQMTSPSVGS